jgi:hypothetical protein
MTLRYIARTSALILLSACVAACAQQKKTARAKRELPQPRVVDPGGPGKAPSDAIVLFDGKDMSGWTTQDGGPARCTVSDGVMNCRTGVGNTFSREKFGSVQIHLEFAIPYMPQQKGQLRGNSGVYLKSCYEIQVLDSYNNPTYADGSCGAVYSVSAPLVNASRPPEQWQSYDIVFHSPRCSSDGSLQQPGSVTVFQNGVLIQDNVELSRPGLGCPRQNMCEPAPLMLQDHSGFPNAPDTTMKFRNIWVRRLEDRPVQQQ